MPEAESALLRAAYRAASVIGEYGAGGSTAFAAAECTARLLPVESDRAWIEGLGRWLEGQGLGPALASGRIELRHCDLGTTGGGAIRLRHWCRGSFLPDKHSRFGL